MTDVGKLVILVGVICLLSYGLSSCAYNPCVDNPRNMSCMSADELERELNAL